MLRLGADGAVDVYDGDGSAEVRFRQFAEHHKISISYKDCLCRKIMGSAMVVLDRCVSDQFVLGLAVVQELVG